MLLFEGLFQNFVYCWNIYILTLTAFIIIFQLCNRNDSIFFHSSKDLPTHWKKTKNCFLMEKFMEFDFNCLYIYAPKMLICMLTLSSFERFFLKYYFIPENCETIKKRLVSTKSVSGKQCQRCLLVQIVLILHRFFLIKSLNTDWSWKSRDILPIQKKIIFASVYSDRWLKLGITQTPRWLVPLMELIKSITDNIKKITDDYIDRHQDGQTGLQCLHWNLNI